MTKPLRFRDYLLLGSLLFGLFFGAGNLIFPVSLGQNAGSQVWPTNLGFLITGTGLPLLGIIAMGVSRSASAFEIASKVNRVFAYIFTILLYMVIGPFFAIPRLATTAFEVGLSPFIADNQKAFFLLVFSIIFFIVAWLFARKPQSLMAVIGKFLTPILLVLLGILFVYAFLKPMGEIAAIPPQATYQNQPFYLGFLDGYNTLDALAALAFGIIITQSLKDMGITQPREITRDIILSGLIGVGLMALIYTFLAILGAQSMGVVPLSPNGGVALATIIRYYLGSLGEVFLGFIVTIACIKTAIGLLTAFAETFNHLFPKISYPLFLGVATLIPMFVANLGLNMIIKLSIPVLMFIYPLAMVLVTLAIIEAFFPFPRSLYSWTLFFTLIAALMDAFNAIAQQFPETLSQAWLAKIITFCQTYLPFYTIGFGWLVPSLIGLVIGVIFTKRSKPSMA